MDDSTRARYEHTVKQYKGVEGIIVCGGCDSIVEKINEQPCLCGYDYMTIVMKNGPLIAKIDAKFNETPALPDLSNQGSSSSSGRRKAIDKTLKIEDDDMKNLLKKSCNNDNSIVDDALQKYKSVLGKICQDNKGLFNEYMSECINDKLKDYIEEQYKTICQDVNTRRLAYSLIDPADM